MITSASEIGGLGSILGVWAHPDDEAYLSGGVMALARDSGARVVCATATRGELGTGDPRTWPPQRLAAERTVEMARCLEILGVTEHHWLGYADGGCARVDPAAPVERLSELLAELRPDTVLTFGPDGITGHPDHQVVSGWATEAFRRAAPPGARLLYAAIPQRHVRRWAALHERFDVYLPGYPVVTASDALAVDLALDPRTAARKVRALAAQATQTSELIAAVGRRRYTAWVGEEAFVEQALHPSVAPPGSLAVTGG